MKMLSDDDLDLKEMTDEELAAAWNLWFSLAQTTNDSDPPYTHGVFVNRTSEDLGLTGGSKKEPELMQLDGAGE